MVNNNKGNFLPEKQKHNNNPNVLTLENYQYVVKGPSNVGRTYYTLKYLKKLATKDLII